MPAISASNTAMADLACCALAESLTETGSIMFMFLRQGLLMRLHQHVNSKKTNIFKLAKTVFYFNAGAGMQKTSNVANVANVAYPLFFKGLCRVYERI
jgi:hypothetical protein